MKRIKDHSLMSKAVSLFILLFLGTLVLHGGVDDNYYKLSDYGGSLSSALTAIGDTKVKLLIDENCQVSTNQVVKQNITLCFVRGKVINIDYCREVSIHGPIEAGAYQIFSGQGYVKGTIKNKSVFPQWWGAVVDDEKDDTDAIKQALYYLQFGAGGELYFLKGQYIISQGIEMYSASDITLKGDKNAILFVKNGTNKTMFYGRYLSNVTIDGLTFDGNRDNQTEGAWPFETCGAFIISQSKHVRIQNCTFRNFIYGICACGENTINVIFDKNYFSNCNSDIDTFGQGYVITNNISDGCTGASIQIEPPNSLAMINEVLPYDLQWDDHILLSLENVISGNTIRGGIYGIVIHSGVCGITISNNTIANVQSCGIKAYHNNIKDIVITGNTIRNVTSETTVLPWTSYGAGIALANPMNCVVSNNIIEYAHTGIYSYKGNRTVITGNICSFNRTSGICAYSMTGGSILNNLLYNNNLNKKTTTSWWANSGILVHSSHNLTIDQNSTIETKGNQRNCVHIYNASAACSNINIGRNFAVGTTHGAVEPLNSTAFSEECPVSTGVNFVTKIKHRHKVRDVGSSAPTTGDWNRGDIMWNSSPASGSNIGWVCVVSGTPGTWKSFGSID